MCGLLGKERKTKNKWGEQTSMNETGLPDEVLVLRFFETGPNLKVEAAFNIVCEKMRERLREHSGKPRPAVAGHPRKRQQSVQASHRNRRRCQPRALTLSLSR